MVGFLWIVYQCLSHDFSPISSPFLSGFRMAARPAGLYSLEPVEDGAGCGEFQCCY